MNRAADAERSSLIASAAHRNPIDAADFIETRIGETRPFKNRSMRILRAQTAANPQQDAIRMSRPAVPNLSVSACLASEDA
ncbi:MAG: hypothetical protein AAGF47_03980 [Planctomycetota bacterium]